MTPGWNSSSASAEYLSISEQITLDNSGLGSHLQGIAEHDTGYFVTTTQKLDGRHAILHFSKVSDHKPDSPMAGNYDTFVSLEKGELHPGGIQAFGNYVAIPVWTANGKGRIRFYAWSDSTLKKCRPCLEADTRVYCVGIARMPGKASEFVLAASVDEDGRKFVSYKIRPGPEFESMDFDGPDHWETSDQYRNSISLLSLAGSLLFVGPFTADGPAHAGGWGNDFVHIHEVTAVHPTPVLTNKKTVHLKAVPVPRFVDQKPAPRWGASARALNGTIEVLCCGYRIQDSGNATRQIDLNRFSLTPSSP